MAVSSGGGGGGLELTAVVVKDAPDVLEDVPLDADDAPATAEEEGAPLLLTPAAAAASERRDAGAGAPACGWRALEGELTMLVATVIYAVQTVLAKVVERGVPSMEVVIARSALSGSVTAATVLVRRWRGHEPDKPLAVALLGRPELRHLLFCRGFFGSVAFSLAYTSLPYLPVADHTALFFLNPIVISLLSWPVLREKVGWREAAAVVGGLIGTVLVVRPVSLFGGAGASGTQHTLGVVLQVFSAFFAAAAMVTVRVVGKRESPFVLALWFHGVSTVTGVLVLLVLQRPICPNGVEYLLLAAVATTSYFGQIILNRGFQLLPASDAAALQYMQVAWGFLLGVSVLGEPFVGLSAGGAALITSGGVLNSVFKRAQQQQPAAAPQDDKPPADAEAR